MIRTRTYIEEEKEEGEEAIEVLLSCAGNGRQEDAT
jgi:hypothetical protein